MKEILNLLANANDEIKELRKELGTAKTEIEELKKTKVDAKWCPVIGVICIVFFLLILIQLGNIFNLLK